MPLTEDEARELVREIRRTLGWTVLRVEDTPFLNGREEKRIRLLAPDGTVQFVNEREDWETLKANFAKK